MEVSLPVPTIVWQPLTLEEAWKTKEKFGAEAQFIAGGTLMQLQREQGIPFPPHLVSLERIKELKGIVEMENGILQIGALTGLEDCQNHSIIRKKYGLLCHAIEAIASPAVRNRATIGGNVLYGIGDALPALVALDAQVLFYTESGFQKKGLWKFLRNDLFSGDSLLLTHIQIPPLADPLRTKYFFKKIGRREAFIPSVVTVALLTQFNQNQEVKFCRLIVGGGIKGPQRLTDCENWLKGKRATETILTALSAKIKKEFEAPFDAFASSNYRKLAAANLLVAALEKKA